MKPLLITIATDNIRKDCQVILDNQAEYAAARGMEHRITTEIHWTDLHPSFSKVWEIHRALEEGAEYFIWADSDVAFTNFKIDLFKLLTPDYFLAAYRQTNWKSWAYLCCGLQVFKNTPQARAYVAEWVKRVEGRFMKDHPFEQWYFDEILRETKWANIRCCTGVEIGCFSKEIWHDGTLWQKGYPSVHLGGPATWERRAEVFRTHYAPFIVR